MLGCRNDDAALLGGVGYMRACDANWSLGLLSATAAVVFGVGVFGGATEVSAIGHADVLIPVAVVAGVSGVSGDVCCCCVVVGAVVAVLVAALLHGLVVLLVGLDSLVMRDRE